MFMNTIAVGPLAPVESWVTGGAAVAVLWHLAMLSNCRDALRCACRGVKDARAELQRSRDRAQLVRAISD